MNPHSLLLALGFAAFACAATASPGAHGPNGEHLDAAPAARVTAASDPRVETFSESFELVARLRPDALVLELGRYANNEPVVDARIEIESGGAKAQARFDATSGSYRVSDAALLQSLRAPGTHPLMFTVTAGSDADLLEGKLRVASASQDSAPGLPPATWPMAASAVFIAGVALAGRRRKARRV